MIYLDNAATTKPLDLVCEEIQYQMAHNWANPSSVHALGQLGNKKFKESLKIFNNILKTNEKNIVFTSGATESINTVIKTFWDSYPRAGKHIITSKVEHSATNQVCKHLETKGFNVTYLSVNKNGQIQTEELEKSITKDTALLSFLHVNNETGAILNIEDIVKLRNTKYPNIKIHLDSVQAFGKIPTYYDKLGIDYISLSAHKLHGPKGIGLIAIYRLSKIKPLLHGGGQQNDFRSGTIDIPSISGFAIAAKIANEKLSENYKYVLSLKNILLEKLADESLDFVCNSPESSSPYIVSLSFKGAKGEVLVNMLQTYDIYVSTSSACKGNKNHKNHVLEQMSVDKSYIDGTIRVGISHFTTKEEIYELCKKIKLSLKKLNFTKI